MRIEVTLDDRHTGWLRFPAAQMRVAQMGGTLSQERDGRYYLTAIGPTYLAWALQREGILK